MKELPIHPNLNGLVELATRDGVDIRPTLLRVMTDLYIQKPMHSAEEEQHFTELALRLFELVDASTRAIVAEKIIGYPNAPAEVRQRVLRDHIALIEVAETIQPATRPPTGNSSAADELSELFFAANSEERRLILLNLPYAPLRPAAPIADFAAHEAVYRLETAALGHNSEAFARELECTLAITRAQALRLIEDESGEPMVVTAIALAMPAAVLQRILLCLNPAISQSVQRVYELAVLHEDVERDAALRLLAIWQASAKAAIAKGKSAQNESAKDESANQGGMTPAASKAARPAGHQPVHSLADGLERAVPPTRPKIRWEEFAQSKKADSA
jgi:hypothetical protein